MRAGLALSVRRGEDDRPSRVAGAQQPGGQRRRLDQQERLGRDGRAREQLSRDERPFRVAVAPIGVQAGDARGAARHDERADDDTVAGEFDRQMRGVLRREARRAVRIDQLGGDDHDRARPGRQRPPLARGDLETRGREARHEGRLVVVAEVGGQLDADRRDRRGVGDQGVSDAAEEGVRLTRARAQFPRERYEATVRDAVDQRVEQTFLPGLQARERALVVDAELHAGGCAPQRRVGGGETQHAAILAVMPPPAGVPSTGPSCHGRGPGPVEEARVRRGAAQWDRRPRPRRRP
ncbi:hypothetical protein AYL44_03395 [Microbacterium oleivorans]|uniref:Uncharacterized protein n=1 Tax=Microbacterium oleivorans TaxID=273677 RepID=A0A177KDW6_9MICO|nr:hypothetical protein AYL44_03395 [Microbacterium oleivorans]